MVLGLGAEGPTGGFSLDPTQVGVSSSLTADICLGVTGTYDLNNQKSSGLPNSWGFKSVGGDAYFDYDFTNAQSVEVDFHFRAGISVDSGINKYFVNYSKYRMKIKWKDFFNFNNCKLCCFFYVVFFSRKKNKRIVGIWKNYKLPQFYNKWERKNR